MKTKCEYAAGPFTVLGILHAGGVHQGAVEYRYRKSEDHPWQPAAALKLPMTGAVADKIAEAKERVKTILRGRLKSSKAQASAKSEAGSTKAVMKVMKKPASSRR
mmetsp:Transcript_86795/g.201970  ORF Transcript_86795/g.201970 Transcript_86795/m.201970 type:complete len:105 (-) Transcript_86795:110-424(-)